MSKKLVIICLCLSLALASCTVTGGGPKNPAPSEKGSYTVSEGYTLKEEIKGISFDITMPKVTHTKNSQIGQYYDEKIEGKKDFIEEFRSGAFDLPEYFVFSEVKYQTVEAKGLICVMLISNDQVEGLTFDLYGKAYTTDELFKLYNITREEADAAILAYHEMPMDYYNDIDSACIYSEDEIYCLAANGGDLYHGYLISKPNGKAAARGYEY